MTISTVDGSQAQAHPLIDGEMPAAALQERLASIVAGAPDVQFDRADTKILPGDLIEAGGIGNLASRDVQIELDQWLDGIDLLVLDNLSSLAAVKTHRHASRIAAPKPEQQRFSFVG